MFSWLHTALLLVVLLALNEIFRRSKWLTVGFYLVLTVFLTAFVWVNTGTAAGSSVNTWFHWAKVYSVITAVLGFTLMRFTKWGANKWVKVFPVAILAINIAEAVARDFELGMATPGTGWHFLNAVAGILSIVTLSGWAGIRYTEDRKRDMIWPDMTVFWIVAYDVWNLVYIWFCVPEHAGYGIAVLLSCTIPAIFVAKGTWIQARAFTLAAWMMYLFTFEPFIDRPSSYFLLPDAQAVLWGAGILSLGLNLAFAFVHFRKMLARKRFGFGQEIHA
jgi:hypothetical protein